MALRSFDAILALDQEKDAYWIEALKHDFALDLLGVISKQGLRAVDLAKKVGVSAPYISRVLRGDENLTVASLVKLARAAGTKLNIHLSETGCDVRWLETWNSRDVPKGRSAIVAWRRFGIGQHHVVENNWAANDYENESAAA